MSKDRWLRLWNNVGTGGDAVARYEELVRRWSEPHRAYHTMQHLGECLAQYESARHLAIDPDAVELAIWYHDAVYQPLASDNEEQSAKLAMVGLRDESFARRVERLILATKHAAVPTDPDARLLVDVDLAILGQPWDRFEEYEKQIRVEFAEVPDPVFKPKRAQVLRSFLERPALYSIPEFRDRLEEKARRNLSRSLARSAVSC